MEGLSLFINGEEISAYIQDGSLGIIISQKSDPKEESKTVIHFGSYDKRTNNISDYYKSELSIGEKLEIEVKNIKETSKPTSIRKFNIVDDNTKIQEYERLKKELEKEGLL